MNSAGGMSVRSVTMQESTQKMMLMFATDVSAMVQGYSGSLGGGQ